MSLEIKTLPLSFCGDEVKNIVNSEAKQYIIDNLEQKYNIKINDKRAYILNNKSVYFLEKTQHAISIKSSGTNYYLFFTNINNTNYCLFIDRKIKQGYTLPRIISVKYRFDDEIFNDTLIDGELIKNEENYWMFLINDMTIYKGQKLECNIVNRFNKIYEMLNNHYTIDKNLDICPLIVKKLFLYNQYDYLITQFIPSLPYKTKGLYFNTLNTKHGNQLYIFNDEHKTKENVIPYNKKETKVSNDTLNDNSNKIFKIVKTNQTEIYDIYCKNGENKLFKYNVACIPNLKTSKFMKKLMADNLNALVYCKFHDKFKKWEPISLCPDAFTENDVSNVSDISSLE
jgi:hypothetical protein